MSRLYFKFEYNAEFPHLSISNRIAPEIMVAAIGAVILVLTFLILSLSSAIMLFRFFQFSTIIIASFCSHLYFLFAVDVSRGFANTITKCR